MDDTSNQTTSNQMPKQDGEDVCTPEIKRLRDEYAALKERRDIAERGMDALKPLLLAHVNKHGDWEEDGESVKLYTPGPRISYSSPEVENLVQAWLASDDPIMKSCGHMLWTHRQEKPGTPYVRVK